MTRDIREVSMWLAAVAILSICAALLGLLLWLALTMRTAHGRDYGQWEATDEAVRNWYRYLMQPDNPNISCCGEADAYWADSFTVEGGKTFATVTDDRDDALLNRPHIPNGTRVAVPDHKYKSDRGNPTGHGVLFMNTSGQVHCYITPGGI